MVVRRRWWWSGLARVGWGLALAAGAGCFVGCLVGCGVGCGGGSAGTGAIAVEARIWEAPGEAGTLAGARVGPAVASSVRGAPVVFVIGATTPSAVDFDLPIEGYSWMRHLAARGRVSYRFDLIGYGDSTRPARMDGPPSPGPPLTRTDEAADSLEIVAGAALAESGADAVHVIAWSAGCTPSLALAGRRPDLVRSLVLYGPTYGKSSGLDLGPLPPALDLVRLLPAYRRISAGQVRERWDGMIPAGEEQRYRDPEVLEAWLERFLASDPGSGDVDPPAARAPAGLWGDGFLVLAGRPPWDAERVRAPTLVVRGDDDRQSSALGCRELAASLVGAEARCENLLAGTHYLTVERMRHTLWDEVDRFLDGVDGAGGS